jgi:hypothetical protein
MCGPTFYLVKYNPPLHNPPLTRNWEQRAPLKSRGTRALKFYIGELWENLCCRHMLEIEDRSNARKV